MPDRQQPSSDPSSVGSAVSGATPATGDTGVVTSAGASPATALGTPVGDRWGGLPENAPLYRLPVVAIDFETTGLAPDCGDAVCEVGLVASTGDDIKMLVAELVNPGRPLSMATRGITGIDERDLSGAPRFVDLLPRLFELIGQAPIVMHNAPFDLHFLVSAASAAGLVLPNSLAIDTLLMARFLGRTRGGNSLRQTAEYYGILGNEAHRAPADARTAALVYHALVPYLELRGIQTVGDLVRGRMAGPARLFAARPSSFLLDLASRAVEMGSMLTLLYAPGGGGKAIERRLRPLALESERYLIGWDLGVAAERTFRLDRILKLSDGLDTYVSPWAGGANLTGPAEPGGDRALNSSPKA